MNIAQLLVRSATVYPTKPAVFIGERCLFDYRTLAARAACVGGYLRDTLGLAPGAVLIGPSSTGWLQDFPVVITKATLSDFIAVNIYMIAFVVSIVLWAVWQGRGDKKTDAVETSTYGRPLVKA